MTVVLRAAMTEQPISLDEHKELVGHRSAGAIVGFAGMIRDHDKGRRVVLLKHSAHPTAAQVVAEVVEKSAGVRAVAASHWIGTLHIGEAALVVAVAADHRQEAFAHLRRAGRHRQGAPTGLETPTFSMT